MNSFRIKRRCGTIYTFYCGRGLSYIDLYITGLGRSQICIGGGFSGITIMAKPSNYEKICRKWYRKHIKELGYA